ncbi:MAG: hypothetical protein EBU66_15880 [Bacteroidetes bacterium]|nr:hypothetical protein [Bacteroidota bacterium]
MQTKITSDILQWAEERGIFGKATPQTQFIKLIEELGELSQGIQKNDIELIEDSIGDCVVVLTILSEMYNLSIDECLESAYNQIKNRKGKMENGVFKKDDSQ